MKIAFCIRENFLANIGGDSVQCLNTKASLETQFQVIVDIITNTHELNNDYDIIHIFNLATRDQTKQFFQVVKRLQKPKIALSPIFWNYEFAAMKDVARALNYSIPTTAFHASIATGLVRMIARLIGKPWILSSSFRAFCKDCLLAADLVLPNSMEELGELARFTHLPFQELGKKTQVVVNATRFPAGTQNAEDSIQKYKLPENFVLQVGRIEFTKNQLNLLRALYNDKQIPLVFVGRSNDSVYEKKLKELASKRGNVFFIEEVSNDQIYGFYRKAALHVLPSFRESPGLVSLEALSQECKIVVADKRFTPVDTYFSSCSTVVDPCSVHSIRDGVFRELSTQRNMLQIREQVLNKFTWENAAKATYEGYQRILAGK